METMSQVRFAIPSVTGEQRGLSCHTDDDPLQVGLTRWNAPPSKIFSTHRKLACQTGFHLLGILAFCVWGMFVYRGAFKDVSPCLENEVV